MKSILKKLKIFKISKMSKISSQTVGLDRDGFEKYYTKAEIAEKCFEKIKETIRLDSNDLIIEPSAGNGSFIPYIKLLGTRYLFFDIEPQHKEIVKQNFLEFENEEKRNIHIVGNPPFGRQSSLAIKFIKKSCEFADSISFILPKSFKKESMRKKFDIYFHLVYEEDLPPNSFVVNKVEYDVPCVFQIWIRKNEKRKEKDVLKPIGYSFVKKNENPDLCFRRVGVYAGKFDNKIDDKSEQSHYFIKISPTINVLNDIKRLNNIKFDDNNTVGPKSISKQELIEKLNNL